MAMTSDKNNLLIIKSSESDVAEKRTDVITRHRSLYSRKAFNADEVIAGFNWEKIHSKPSYLTVQISDTEHIELMPAYLECVNHSCDPNSFFDTTKRLFIAVKPIKKGEEFTFFYPSSEWDMDQAFQCTCHSEGCLGLIKGAKYLPADRVKNYRFTEFIQQKLRVERKLKPLRQGKHVPKPGIQKPSHLL
jgi:hypothetical protein